MSAEVSHSRENTEFSMIYEQSPDNAEISTLSINDNKDSNNNNLQNDRSHASENVVTELDIKELERRQLEANEETTRSEDLRLFLQEMREKCLPADSNVSNKSPTSYHRQFSFNTQPDIDLTTYKGMIDPCQESDLHALATETAPMAPPDGGWAWLVVTASFVCMTIIDGTCFNYGLFVPDMMSTFPQSHLMPYIWPGSLIAGFYMSIGPIASALSSQYDFRPIAMAGAIISGLAIFLSSFMNNILTFILFFGIFGGIGFGLLYLPAIAIVGHWFHKKRPIAVGVALCGSGVGTLLFGELIPWLIDVFTWKGTLILIAAACVQCMVLIALFRPLELHLRLEQLAMIRSTYRKLQHEEHQRKRLEEEHKHEVEKMRRKAAKDELRLKNRTKHKRIVIYRGSIMEKIIAEKKRQRTTSMGSLDGMVITRDNELIKVPTSAIDLYEKPILSTNAINRITESVVKRLESKAKKHGTNRVFTTSNVSDSRTGRQAKISINQFKNSLPQLVQDYVNSQLSLQMASGQTNTLNSINSIAEAFSRQQSVSSVASSKISNNPTGLVLQDNAKEVIQASLRKEMMRPLQKKEVFFTGSMHQLANNERSNNSGRSSIITIESSKRSPVSFNLANRPNTNITDSGAQSFVDGIELNQLGMDGDAYSNQFAVDGNQPTYYTQQSTNDTPFCTFMKDLLDVNLLTSPTFILLSVASVSSMLGVFIPFFFLPGYILSLQKNLATAGHLISFIGFTNTVGRILATIYIEKASSSNYPWADCLWINNLALITAGVSVCCVPFLIHNLVVLTCVLCVYGVCVAGFVSLKSILVVELLGLNRLTTAFGFLLIFQGIAIICGPPIAAVLCDLSRGQYEVAFYFSGAFIILSGVLCCALRNVSNLEQRYLERRYGPPLPDNENCTGIAKYTDFPTKDQTDATTINEQMPTVNKDDAGDKPLEDTPKVEIIEDPILEPVVEEEEDFHCDSTESSRLFVM